MDENQINIIFKYLSYKINKNQIYEKNQFLNISDNLQINKNDMIIDYTKQNFILFKVKISDNEFIIIKEKPINFLLSFSIFIGENTKIYKVKLKQDNNIYYIQKENLNYITEILEFKYELIDVKYLYNKESILKTPIKIINEFKEYIKKTRNIDLNKIHIIESNKIENFNPTLKEEHFIISKRLNITSFQLIENNFLKGSIYNLITLDDDFINNYKSDILFKFEEKDKLFLNKKNKNKVYFDVRRNFYLKYDKEKIIDIITNSNETNYLKNPVINEIKNIESIKISSNNLEIPLFLFKDRDDKFLAIKDLFEFKLISGRDFKLEFNFLKDLLLLNRKGVKVEFCNKGIDRVFYKAILDINHKEEKSNIFFKNIKDLILKIDINIMNKKKIENLIKFEEINKNLNHELYKIIKDIIKKTIVITIKYNKFPEKKVETSIYEQFFTSIETSIHYYIREYKKNFKKNETIKIILKKLLLLKEVLKSKEISFEELYFLNRINPLLIELLERLNIEDEIILKEKQINNSNNKEKEDQETKSKIKDLYYSFYKKENTNNILIQSKINENLENLIYNISKANNISKKKEIKIFYKKDFNKIYINSDIKEIEKNIKIQKIIKPNLNFIKKNFKYNYNEVIIQIKKFEDLGFNKKININNKEIKVTSDFYIEFLKFENHKKLIENEYFDILIKE